MSLPYIPYNRSNADRAKSMRKKMTKAEQRMRFEILKKRPLWYKFIRQKMIWSYILDFYCSKLLLAIEVDGSSHINKEDYDASRSSYLNDLWIQVLRYANDDVMSNTEKVRDDIHQHINLKLSLPWL